MQQAEHEAFGARWSQRGVGDALVALGRREEAEKEFRESLAAVGELADYPDLLSS